MHKKGAVNVICRVLFQDSRVVFNKSSDGQTIALLIRQSIFPKSFSTFEIVSIICDSDPKSISYARTSPPAAAIVARTSSRFFLFISNKATLAPSAAIRIAISRPMLRPEPVITTVLPFNELLIRLQRDQFLPEYSLILILLSYGLEKVQLKTLYKLHHKLQNLYERLVNV